MNDYDYKPILSRLKSAKEASGMTNEELSVASGVSLGTLNKILSGDTKAPQLPAMMAIAAALGTSVDYLAYGRTTAPAPVALSTAEAELIALYRSFSEEGREKVLTYAADLDRAGIYKNNRNDRLASKEA